MKDIVEHLMIPISNQLKMIIYQEVFEPDYNKNADFWMIKIRVMKPISGSLEIKLTHPKNEELPILSWEIYCEKSYEYMRGIFIEIIKLIDNKIYRINTSENFIGLHWRVNFDSKNEAEIDFIKFSKVLPRILIILKDLGLFQIKSLAEIINSTDHKFIRGKKKVIIAERSNKIYLIRRDLPAIIPNFKSDYYFSFKYDQSNI